MLQNSDVSDWTVKAIRIRQNDGRGDLSGMQFIYENDEESKMFGIEHHPDGKVLEMPTETPIRAVQLRRSHYWCKGLKFLDGEGNTIVDHTWMGQGDYGSWT